MTILVTRENFGRCSPPVLMLGALLVATLLPFGACREQPEKVAAPKEKITIASTSLPNSALVSVAVAKGFFAAEGVEVTQQVHEFGRLATAAVLEGKADLATPADTPVVFAIEGGNDLVVVAVISRSREAVGVAARKDRGINRVADLRGKRVGVPRGTTAHYFLGSILSLAGFDERDVRVVDLRPGAMAAALRAGEVDAVAIWQPVLRGIALELGGNGVVFTEPDLYSDTGCLVGTRAFVTARPGAVKKVLRALLQAEDFVGNHPDESRGIVAAATGDDPGPFAETWRLWTFGLALDQSLLLSLEDQSLWARRSGLVGEGPPPDFLEHIWVDGLLAVKPEAARQIR